MAAVTPNNYTYFPDPGIICFIYPPAELKMQVILQFDFRQANARASAAARWLSLGQAWSEYKNLLDYKPTLPAKLP